MVKPRVKLKRTMQENLRDEKIANMDAMATGRKPPSFELSNFEKELVADVVAKEFPGRNLKRSARKQ
jgi:hypothetical protein